MATFRLVARLPSKWAAQMEPQLMTGRLLFPCWLPPVRQVAMVPEQRPQPGRRLFWRCSWLCW